MPVIDLVQGSDAWLQWREGGIGGSDAGAVMGENRWCSPDKLAQEKRTRFRKVKSPAMQRGNDLEPEARRLYQELTGIVVRPVCMIHSLYPWMRASLDGLSDDGQTVLEIKCPTNPRGHLLALRQIVPDYHRAQLQHNLAVSGATRMHFVSYYPEFEPGRRLAVVVVDPDPEYQEALIEAERQFMLALRAEVN